jgi:hypothetical protein
MFKALLLTFVLALLLPLTAHAQEPTPLDIATLTCVGPGFIPDGDPFEALTDLPMRNCQRACKAAAQGCKAVSKAIDKCGVSLLKASAKTGNEICRGHGGMMRECRGVQISIKPDIDWWKAEGKREREECDADMQTFCMSRCQAPARGTAMPSTQGSKAPQGGVEVTTVTRPGTERIVIPQDPGLTQGHSSFTNIIAPEVEPITISQDPEVRDAAEDTLVFLK